jgi:phosphohistidine phosphatase
MTAASKLILVRHGEATSTAENPERPLTDVGRQHAERVASWLKRCGHGVDEIRHSDKLRALETAKIFGNRLEVPPAKVRRSPGLKPHDDPAPLAVELEVEERPLMIVGHLPFLNRLASVLLVGDPDKLQFRFADAGAVVLAACCGGWQVEAVAAHDMVD